MKVYKLDRRSNFLDLEIDTLDDLWILNLIISEGDLVGSKSTRRFRVQGSDDSEKKTVFVKLRIEKKLLDLKNQSLKLTGIIESGHPEEYVELKSHHSLDLGIQTKFTLEKAALYDYEIDLINDSKKNSLLPKVIIVVLDDDDATIARVMQSRYEIISIIKSGKAGKILESASTRNSFFLDVYNSVQLTNPDYVIVAGPGFEKDYFKQYIDSKKSSIKYIFTNVNTTGVTGINELIKGGSLTKITNAFFVERDSIIVSELISDIAKKKAVAYGLRDVSFASNNNMISNLYVSDLFFSSNYSKVRDIIYHSQKNNSTFHIISSDNEPGKMLDGIGGIAAKLYYKLDN